MNLRHLFDLRAAALQVALRIVALAAIAGSAVALLQRPALRAQFDATQTGAFTLGGGTRALLQSLDGQWNIVVVLTESSVSPAVRRQIDEVLRRFAETAPAMRCHRIDPTDPGALGAWESLVASIQSSPAGGGDGRLATFRVALDDAVTAHERFLEFARSRSQVLESLLQSHTQAREQRAVVPGAITGDPAIDRELASLRERLQEFASDGHVLLERVLELRTTSMQQPLADDERARGLLTSSLSHWSDQCLAAATSLEAWSTRASLPEAFRRTVRELGQGFEAEAQQLHNAQDQLARQPVLELSQIGRQLASGEVAVIVGPPGAAVVPSWQLLSAGGAGEAPDRRFGDRRFRGEQVLAAALRSLLRPPPMVVLLHAEEASPLRATADRNDLAAVGEALRAARYDVQEWRIEDPAPPIPSRGAAAEASRAPDASANVVYLVAPPMSRRGIDLDPRERVLIDRTRRLIEEGKPVLLTVARSLRPLFRQEDPWAAMLASRGVRIETGSVIFELDRIGPARGVTRAWQRIEPVEALDGGSSIGGSADASVADTPRASPSEPFTSSIHPIARAIAGQPTTVTHPTPLTLEPAHTARRTALLSVDPAPGRWLERDWRSENRPRSTPPAGAGFETSLPIAVAIEEPGQPVQRRRLIVVGSGGWLLSSVLDASEPVGAGRSIPVNPGNRELLLASIAWLAGMDEYVAPSGSGVPRLAGIDSTTRLLWSVMAIGALPLSMLLLGAATTIARRRA